MLANVTFRETLTNMVCISGIWYNLYEKPTTNPDHKPKEGLKL